MGLITGVLTLPLAPVRGFVWLSQQIYDEAEGQLYDEGRIRAELLQLELDFEDGVIDARQRDMRSDELLERLAVTDERRQQAALLGEPEDDDG